MKRAILILLLLGVTVLSGVWWYLRSVSPVNRIEREQTTRTQREFVRVHLGEQEYEMVVSRTPEQIEQGLSDREEIGADGMLFLLPQRIQTAFWMYRMKFPLDVIWIDGGRVVDIHAQLPAVSADTPAQEIPRVLPRQPVEAVIEVSAGFAEQEGVELGAEVKWVLPGNWREW